MTDTSDWNRKQITSKWSLCHPWQKLRPVPILPVWRGPFFRRVLAQSCNKSVSFLRSLLLPKMFWQSAYCYCHTTAQLYPCFIISLSQSSPHSTSQRQTYTGILMNCQQLIFRIYWACRSLIQKDLINNKSNLSCKSVIHLCSFRWLMGCTWWMIDHQEVDSRIIWLLNGIAGVLTTTRHDISLSDTNENTSTLLHYMIMEHQSRCGVI